MRSRRVIAVLAVAVAIVAGPTVWTQQAGQAPQAAPPSTKPILYVISTSHHGAPGRATVQDAIRDVIPPTFFESADRFDAYPSYAFSYDAGVRYMWFKEYYPDYWPILQQYVNQNRWRLAGAWIDAADTNVPSPESLMRQALYAKGFFRREFGRVPNDIYLPDALGAGFALPAIAAHSGLNAFTTEAFQSGTSVKLPFAIGRWRGVDGSEILAVLNPGNEMTKIEGDLAIDPASSKDLITVPGRPVGVRLFSAGERGGAPDEASIAWLNASVANKSGAVEVRNTAPDQLARDLTPQQRAALPVYEGELTMKTDGVGAYTSQAAMKRLNHQNEQLADAAERASVAAEWASGATYPADRLRAAWIRMLAHQSPDDLGGSAIPQAYQFSWNDELVSANQFAGVLTNAVSAIAGDLDTTTSSGGVPVVVYNALSSPRRDVVEATVRFPERAPTALRVIDTVSKAEVPVQVLDARGNEAHILFVADVSSVGFKVFEVRSGASHARAGAVSATASTLENARYTVKFDVNGDISGIYDRDAAKELLKAPIRLELRDDPSPDKAARRILFATVAARAREFAVQPSVRVIERGPVRAVVEITREAAGSTFVQRVSLVDGGDRVDVDTDVNWRSTNTLLKVSFPFAASNPKATYDLGLGTIARGNNTADHYEVPAQEWADLTDASGAFGAAVLDDSTYGWDKPADNVIRLTLLHTPRSANDLDAATNDLGRQRFAYAVAGHRDDWVAGHVAARAASLNQPLIAFQATSHAGAGGRSLSLVSFEDPSGQVTIAAIKQAEDTDEIVVRLEEQSGRPAHVRVAFAEQIVTAREINAAEEPVRPFAATDGKLVVDFKRYQPRTFAIRLAPPTRATPAPVRLDVPLDLPFNLDGISLDSDRADGDLDGRGRTIAGELLPGELRVDDVWFKLGSRSAGDRNVLVPNGQTLPLPPCQCTRVYVLAAAVAGDQSATFVVQRGRQPGVETAVVVRDWEGPIGQADSRLRAPRLLREPTAPLPAGSLAWTPEAIQADLVVKYDAAAGTVSRLDEMRPAFVKRDEIAWAGSHRHAPDGNQIAVPSYIFLYQFELPPGATALKLPAGDRLRIFAITGVRESDRVTSARTLYAAEWPDK